MKFLLPTTAIAFGLLVATGCNQSSPGGHAETKSTTKSGDTFTLKAPTLATTIKQGDKQTITLTVDRGSDFKQNVKLSTGAPKGLKVDFANTTVNSSDKADVSVSITADKDAPVGDHTIKVVGKPDSGTDTSVDVKVKVEATK
ncbi:COG1470 family protein [Limnoglobus roseus]|uniref:Lipoprotein n=1 Tax=Limnoglobus roseus TaxID=2598579 RepID=A0A5C1AVK9_9BACT|nr:hypothetical protein [Limnoglobus roseus]QEL20848.1 hypothetical protein PX52LOC_07968 [Limnoglobus roseus]